PAAPSRRDCHRRPPRNAEKQETRRAHGHRCVIAVPTHVLLFSVTMAPLRALCLLLSLLSLCGLASAACGFGKYDFSSLAGKDLVGKDSGSTYSYHLRVCGNLEGPAKCTNTAKASACQLHVSMDAP